jgi:[acyl-carrier-protein] S-malonyltransferase
MAKALVFPGQGAQFEGMGKDLFEAHESARKVFIEADEILGYSLSSIMFNGSAEELKETKITQPALFVHAIAKLKAIGMPEGVKAVAGHSLGEFTALVAADALSFEDALKLVYQRAMAMQAACDETPGTMAAVLGLDDAIVESICSKVQKGIVVAANYNCPGQLVISGSIDGINQAIEDLKAAGVKRAILLPVGGAFHSPLMESAKEKLKLAINTTVFNDASVTIYQNVNASPTKDSETIKINLINQLTGPVKWTQSIQNMVKDGITEFLEVGGTGKVLSGLISKIDREVSASSI